MVTPSPRKCLESLGKKKRIIKKFRAKIGNFHKFWVKVGNFPQMKSKNLDFLTGARHLLNLERSRIFLG